MAISASTGLRNVMLAGTGAKAALDLGFIKLYSGAVPANADTAIAGTLLCTISINGGGTGLTMDTAAVNGVLSKAPAAVWSGINAASGSASFYRHVGPTDTGAASTTEPRLQGLVGQVGSDMNLSAGVALTAGISTPLDSYLIALPAQ